MGRPVNQFVQLACFNKSRLAKPPGSLEELAQSSDDATFGMAIQLKDLFWSAEAFNATPAFQAAMDGSSIDETLRIGGSSSKLHADETESAGEAP